jgi:hypothetical protein
MDAERTVELTFNMTTATAATNARTSRTPTAIHKDENALTTKRNFQHPLMHLPHSLSYVL